MYICISMYCVYCPVCSLRYHVISWSSESGLVCINTSSRTQRVLVEIAFIGYPHVACKSSLNSLRSTTIWCYVYTTHFSSCLSVYLSVLTIALSKIVKALLTHSEFQPLHRTTKPANDGHSYNIQVIHISHILLISQPPLFWFTFSGSKNRWYYS